MKKNKCQRSHVISRRAFLHMSGVLGGSLALSAIPDFVPFSFAKDIYPAEKITWITPYKAGGGFDLTARVIGPYLTKYLQELSPGAKGGGVSVKNEVGAAGQRAYSQVYFAKPDGYTLGCFDIFFATEALMSKLDFDLQKFIYLLRVNTTTRLLVTGKNGFGSWEDMIKASKAKDLKWGVGYFGRSLHVDSVIVKEEVGIPAVRFIPLGSTSECMNALLRGDIQVALVSEDSVKGLVTAGEIKVLTIFDEQSEYRGVPSIKDLGYPGLVEKLGGHRFVIAPPSLPKEIQNILITAFKKTLNDKEFRAWAKKTDTPLNPIYGDEADMVAKKMLRFYQEDLKPVLLKYLS